MARAGKGVELLADLRGSPAVVVGDDDVRRRSVREKEWKRQGRAHRGGLMMVVGKVVRIGNAQDAVLLSSYIELSHVPRARNSTILGGHGRDAAICRMSAHLFRGNVRRIGSMLFAVSPIPRHSAAHSVLFITSLSKTEEGVSDDEAFVQMRCVQQRVPSRKR